jgi:hypothetical protein
MEPTAAMMMIGQECHQVLSSQEWETVLGLESDNNQPPSRISLGSPAMQRSSIA